jgi:glutamate-1-semialdehyde 2,1-aminomutase
VTEGAARDTLTVPFNDVEALEDVAAERGDAIAAVIVEPVAANMGVVPPEPGFLERLRELTKVHGALLVFDEVITGFRIAFGGAQSVYGVAPDLTILGKVMGGGFPCAAFGGRRDVMERLAPVGPVYQAGTLSGNPVAVAAGIAALDLAKELDPYPALSVTAIALAEGLTERFSERGVGVTVNRAESLFSVSFSVERVRDFAGARTADRDRYSRLFHHMLDRGVWLPPSGYELWTLGTEHGPVEVELVLRAAESFGG